MDRFDAIRLFTRIVERRSFTQAAQDLGLPRSTVTEAIRHLEARLGVRLLQRTTRVVSPTLDGEAYYHRCLAILADIEDAEAAFGDTKPRGLLRIDVHGTLARHFLLPGLTDFLERYPGLQLHIGEGDRLVDLVREGIDCVIRAGDLQDSSMVARRVALLAEATCASPAYLARHGMPTTPGDLEGHRMVGFVSSATGSIGSVGAPDSGFSTFRRTLGGDTWKRRVMVALRRSMDASRRPREERLSSRKSLGFVGAPWIDADPICAFEESGASCGKVV